MPSAVCCHRNALLTFGRQPPTCLGRPNRILPTANRVLPPTVASFLIPPTSNPLLSIKSVASFCKSSQHSAISDRFPVLPSRPCPTHKGTASRRQPIAANRGFVPDSADVQSFVINQIGGFVFQKLSVLSHLSAISSRSYRAGPMPFVRCIRPVAYCFSFFLQLPTLGIESLVALCCPLPVIPCR